MIKLCFIYTKGSFWKINGARFYEFSKTYQIYIEIKEKILTVNPELDYTVNELIEFWIEASKI
jgi:hypothetical protein